MEQHNNIIFVKVTEFVIILDKLTDLKFNLKRRNIAVHVAHPPWPADSIATY